MLPFSRRTDAPSTFKRRQARRKLRALLACKPRLAIEPLEQRIVLSVSLDAISGPDANSAFDVPSGKSLYVPLVGTDSNQTISYSSTSSNSHVTAAVLANTSELSLTVHGTKADGGAFSGTMTFALFADVAPHTVQGIIDNVNAGLYQGASFYRMETASTFQLIQGGIEKTSGKSDSTVLPDEFNVAATFNSSGLLAMANGGASTATSEFFITAPNRPLADDPQSLNFGYTIFGQILTGSDIYADILGVSTTSSGGINYANTPVTIDSASIITDHQNAVLRVSEPADFVGTSSITVTATGSDASTAQQSFSVNIVAPSSSSQVAPPLFLAPVADQTTAINTPVSFQISATESSGGAPSFSVTGASGFTSTPANVTVSVTPGSGNTATVTLTPATGFSGTISLLAHADDSSSALHDAQAFTLTVEGTVAVTSVTTPISQSNVTQTAIQGTGTAGDTISVVASDGTHSTNAQSTTVASDGTWSITGIDVTSLSDGTLTYTATDTTDGTSHATATATKDTVVPAVSVTTVDQANVASVSVSGTGEAGATISLVASDGTTTTTAKTTSVASNGTWSITGIDIYALADGTVTFTATATDSAGNSAQATKTATKTVSNNASLSGFVYVDLNNSGTKTDSDLVLEGVILTLTGLDAQSNPIPSQTTTTASDGSYHFENLSAGTYTITTAQPKKLNEGVSVVGSLSGTSAPGVISNIVVGSGETGTAYNFSEAGLDRSMFSLALFLASTPPIQQVFDNVVSTWGTTSPVVMALAESSTSQSTVTYSVSFNRGVSGVDASDFITSGTAGASIAGVSGSGSSYTVTLNTSSSGTVGLSLVDDDSIVDSSNSPLGGRGTSNDNFVGGIYTPSASQAALSPATSPAPNASSTAAWAAHGLESAAAATLSRSNASATATAAASLNGPLVDQALASEDAWT